MFWQNLDFFFVVSSLYLLNPQRIRIALNVSMIVLCVFIVLEMLVCSGKMWIFYCFLLSNRNWVGILNELSRH
jgi:hypothetical protein